MTIKVEQFLAARALLRLGQKDICQSTGITQPKLSSFERQEAGLSPKNLNKLRQFYEDRGVEFLNHCGVRMKPQGTIRTLNGGEGFKEFMNDVYETANREGGEICIFNSKPSLWYEWLTKEWYQMHAERMHSLGDRIKIRIIVQSGEDFLILKAADHRQYPKELHDEKIFYIYGSKLAFLDFSHDSLEIKIFNQNEFADLHREIFGLAWDHSLPVR